MTSKFIQIYNQPTPTLREVIRELTPLIRDACRTPDTEPDAERRRKFCGLQLPKELEEIDSYVKTVRTEDLVALFIGNLSSSRRNRHKSEWELMEGMLRIPPIRDRMPGFIFDLFVQENILAFGEALNLSYLHYIKADDVALSKISAPYIGLLMDYVKGFDADYLLLPSREAALRISHEQRQRLIRAAMKNYANPSYDCVAIEEVLGTTKEELSDRRTNILDLLEIYPIS